MGTLTWKLSGGASTPHDGFANETLNTFEYNGFGLRVEKTDSLGTASFLTDGLTVASPVLNDGSAVYTHGVGLASERRGNATSAYHLDGLGSTRLMTDSSQAITNALAYDAFGNTLSGTAATPLKYAGSWGYQSDVDNGLMLLGHRYYDPALGRFLTPDPIKDGSNWYAYCGNNPLGSVDPTGLAELIMVPMPGSLRFIPAHVYIRIDGDSWGLWPAPGRWDSGLFIGPGKVHHQDDHGNDPAGIILKENDDPAFEARLRDHCQRQDARPPLYSFLVSNCVSWANEAWRIAENRPPLGGGGEVWHHGAPLRRFGGSFPSE